MATLRAAAPVPAGEVGPVLAEASPLPPQYRVGDCDHERAPHPDPGQPDPEKAVHHAKPGPGGRPLVHGELLTQGEVLEDEPAVAAAEECEQPKQVEQKSNHRAEILSGSEPTDQPLAQRTEFWRRTGGRSRDDLIRPRRSYTSPRGFDCVE